MRLHFGISKYNDQILGIADNELFLNAIILSLGCSFIISMMVYVVMGWVFYMMFDLLLLRNDGLLYN
jgi:hypothetical protein